MAWILKNAHRDLRRLSYATDCPGLTAVSPTKNATPGLPKWRWFEKTEASGESLEFCLELILGDAGTDDLILHFAVLEEQEQRDRAHVVFDGEFAGFIHVHLADFGGTFEFGGNLVDHRADHFAGTTPFGPKVHEDGHGGIDDFGLEICVGKFQRHARNMERDRQNVKSRPAKIAGRLSVRNFS